MEQTGKLATETSRKVSYSSIPKKKDYIIDWTTNSKCDRILENQS